MKRSLKSLQTVALALALFPGSVAAETLDCQLLSGSHRMLCIAMARCSRMEGETVRNGCVNAVLQAVGISTDEVSPVARPPLPSQPKNVMPPQAPPVAPATADVGVQEEPESVVQPILTGETVKPKVAPSLNVSPSIRSVAKQRADKEDSKGKDSSGVPKKFTATVVEAQDLVRERQIMLLDNGLLFEGGGPAFDPGLEVNVSKRGFFGNTWVITSSKSRSMEFQRIRCELPADEANSDTVRKCRRFLD